MPQRLSERTFKTPSVQGEDSWIRVRSLTVGEVLEVQRKQEQSRNVWHWLGRVVARVIAFTFPGIARRGQAGAYMELAHNVCEKVTAWNWVDGDSMPLPLPTEDQRVIERLSPDEIGVIMQAVYGNLQSEEQKN